MAGARQGVRIAAGSVGSAAAIIAGAAVGWGLYSGLGVDHAMPLPPAIDAERRELHSREAGQVSYYAAEEGPGRPLVLIHSVNAAASAYEMGPLFAAFRGRRPVYALDLPGFGFSERGDRPYVPALFVAAISALLDEAVRGDEPIDLVALSLGAEFAARVALDRPGRVGSLALISPSGLGWRRGPMTSAERAAYARASERRLRAFSNPLWAQPFYDLLVSPPSIRYFLRQSFQGPPDPGLVAYDYATGHQPGARFAPLAFISGGLFARDILPTVYARLEQPTLVLYDRDGFVSFDALPDLLARRPNWRAERIAPTRGLPHFEELGRTTAALDRFWAG